MVACPNCGKPMDDGFVGAKNWPTGIQWYAKKSFFGIVGEPIGESDRTQMSWLAASRCTACRTILTRY